MPCHYCFIYDRCERNRNRKTVEGRTKDFGKHCREERYNDDVRTSTAVMFAISSTQS